MLPYVITKDELYGWMRYYNTKEADVNEVQMAMLLSMLSNYMGGKQKPKDFILSSKRKPKHQDKPHTAFDSFAAVAKDFGT